MSLQPGTHLGPYEILSPLGVGGMGEVYRARDKKLDRDVAIKVLPDSLANDPERLARFNREAQVLAALNHPNIAHIHGFEDSTGVPALVMELVEGPTLAERLAGLRAKGSGLPLDEALPIARQIADALEAAHEQGIIHRDLKPANIKVRDDGIVKVLDFGLAKALDNSGSVRLQPDLAQSPTITTPAMMTGVGMILGTAAYMSPEQAKGRPADRRSDMFAFGCVLFEMISGKRAFDGEEIGEVFAAVIRGEPDWRALPPNVPAGIEKLLRRCLAKDRKERLADAADARLEIMDALAAPSSDSSASAGARSSWRRSAVLAVVAFVVGGLVAGVIVWGLTRSSRADSPASVVRFAIHDTDKVIISRSEGDMALSPDGRTLAFVGFGEGGARIWVRLFDALEARSLPGTEGASSLGWSPDGRSLAFVADRRLKKMVVADGTPEVVCLVRNNLTTRLAWGPDGTILYTDSRGLWRVPASGGTPVRLSAYEGIYDSPHFLPDGRHFLVAVRSPEVTKAGTFVSTLDESSRMRLLTFPTSARYARGRLLFVRDRMLYAQTFDLSRLQFTGDALPIATSVAPTFTVSDGGAAAYLPLGPSGQPDTGQLVWMNRSGQVQERIDQAAGAQRPSLSPDGRRLAMSLRADIWVLELARGVLSRLTFGAAVGGAPVWLPDSQHVMFFRSAFRNSKDVIFETSVGSVGTETMVREPVGQHAHVTDVSSDGQYLIYEGEEDGYDIWVQRLTGDRKASAYVPAPSVETQGALSPDGHWLAYTSDLSGRFEIYVQSFPEPGSRIQVSPNGGTSARWRRDGKELFYLTPDGRLTVVPVRSAQPLEFGAPAALFQFFSVTQRGIPAQPAPYDVTADGQRFIVSSVARRTDPSIDVLLNWPALAAAPKP